MVLQEKHIEGLIARYVKDKDTISIGSGKHGETFLKKLAFAIEDDGIDLWDIRIVPTSLPMAAIASQLKIPIVSLNEEEIDVAVEFVDAVDEEYNFLKRDSSSLVRDKMIAESAAILIAVAEEKNFVKKLKGRMPFEISTFGWQRTINQLEKMGTAKLRVINDRPFKTESGHYLVDVIVDDVFSLDELEFQAKEIPGVLETGLFIGYADKILLHNGKLQLKSRTEFKQ
jgi:ribose 5-phosphate isomerase A